MYQGIAVQLASATDLGLAHQSCQKARGLLTPVMLVMGISLVPLLLSLCSGTLGLGL